MSKGTISLIVIGVVVLLLVGGALTSYNGLVQKDEAAATAWSNVQSQYQRRADLIPNLVNTVKGYAKHESGTLESVVAARAKATQLTVNADELTPEKMKQLQAAQGELSQALGRLLMITENYPELKANENYLKCMNAVDSYEKMVRTSRLIYNDSVTKLNRAIRMFPTSLIAGMLGFHQRDYLEAVEDKEEMPRMK